MDVGDEGTDVDLLVGWWFWLRDCMFEERQDKSNGSLTRSYGVRLCPLPRFTSAT